MKIELGTFVHISNIYLYAAMNVEVSSVVNLDSLFHNLE